MTAESSARARLSDRQRALLEALRRAEERGGPVDVDLLAERTAYSAASIRTYFSKKLDGVLAFREGDGWRIRGALRCSEAEFARHLTQKAGATGAALETEAAWRTVVRKLLYEGQRRHYTLGPDEAALARALLADRTLAPPVPTIATPPRAAPAEPGDATRDRPQRGLFEDR